jgi:hypothetical protein
MQYVEYVGAIAGAFSSYAERKPPILDPMLTVLKFGLLAFEPQGTKIGMTEFGFDLQPPGISQSIYRRFASQGHDDLGVFGETIKKVVFQYKTDKNDPFQKALKVIFENAVKGLEKLQETYPNSTTSEAITTWIHLLKGEVKVDPSPHISQIAEKVKEEWKLHYIQDFAKWFEEAAKSSEQKATSTTSEKELEYSLGMIKGLISVKQLQFERILYLNKAL